MIAEPPVLARVLFSIDQVLEMDRAGLLPSDRRIELVGGELFVMPSPGPAHIAVVTNLQAAFNALNAQKRLLVQQSLAVPDFDLPSPDIMVLREPIPVRLPTPSDCLLVIEVSDSTLKRDRDEKLPQYLRAGVPEVWIVDVRGRSVSIYVAPSLLPARTVREGAINPDATADWPVVQVEALFEGLPS